MAKRNARDVSGDKWDKVLVATRKLQDAHGLGRELLKKYPIGKTFGQGVMRREADERGTNTDALYKMRVFADPEKGYSSKELSALCQLCKRYRRALGFAFVVRLLTVHDKSERAKLQRRVIAERWSLIALKLQLVSRYGHRRQAGKRPKIKDLEDLLAALSTKTIWWRRLYGMLELGDQTRPKKVSLADMPYEIRKPFDSAVKAIKRLEDALLEARSIGVEGVRHHRKNRAPGGTERPDRRTATPSRVESGDLDMDRIRRLAKAAASFQKASGIKRG